MSRTVRCRDLGWLFDNVSTVYKQSNDAETIAIRPTYELSRTTVGKPGAAGEATRMVKIAASDM
jgi:hypothetical protein